MRTIFVFFLLMLLLSGCIPRVKTDIPAFSGTVIDSNSGLPLSGVTIEEQADHAPEGWLPRSSVSGIDGKFSYQAVTSGIVAQLLAPGAGWPVRRILTFQKDGYRDTICSCTNFSLFGEENYAAIPLVQNRHSEPPLDVAPLLQLNDNIACQAFVGSRVLYEGQPCLIGEINWPEGQNENPLFTLWTLPPNGGDVVMDVEEYFIQLVSGDRQEEK